MRRKIRLYKKVTINLNKPQKIVLTVILLIISLILIFRFIDTKVTPLLVNYAEMESRKFASVVINKAISNTVNDLNVDELFIITKDENGEIKTIDFNPLVVNKTLSNITNSVQINLRYIEQGKLDELSLSNDLYLDYNKEKLRQGIIYEIPSGIVFGNSLLSNLGPKIPVRLSLVGDIVSNIKTNITNYGINNALIEISVNLEVREQIILPFTSKVISIETNVPIALKLTQGTVPNYYMNGINENSPLLTIPIE